MTPSARLLPTLAAAAALFAATAAPATARIEAAVPIAGPDPAIGELGGVAMAADGTGGLVYTRFEEGHMHVYAARYDGRHWGTPQRVDTGQRFDSAWPRIGAAAGGRLVVTWTQEGGVGLDSMYSAALPRAGTNFLPPTLVDYTIGEARGTHPSLAMNAGGDALLAYRVIADFEAKDAPPGYVYGEIRLARFEGSRWKRFGTIVNRNTAAPQRLPDAANSPKVALAADGSGVVAWQEPDERFVDKVWARRVFGTRAGVPLPAGPAELGGRANAAPADALAVDVTDFGRAVVAIRQQPDPRDRGGAARVYVNELPETSDEAADEFLAGGARLADGGPGAGLGAPSVILGDRVSLLLGFPRGGASVVASGEADLVEEVRDAGGLPEPAAAIDAGVDGRGTLAFASGEGGGRVVVQELRGARPIRTQGVSGPAGGVVRGIAAAGSGTGDALVAFAQGESDEGQIAVARVEAPPVPFAAITPTGWTRARRPLVTWTGAPEGFRPRSYTIEIDGKPLARRPRGTHLRLPEGVLRDGRHRLRVIAVNRVGETTATRVEPLNTDRRPPSATLVQQGKLGRLARVSVSDGRRKSSSGPSLATQVIWGDGARSRGRKPKHRYKRPGLYLVTVKALDRARNVFLLRQRLRVR
jgi:hypothetical protein